MRLIIFFVAFISTFSASACTTFFLHNGNDMVFGRNYDWVADAGMVCTSLRGMTKTSSPTKDGNTITWTSRFGSITFNQYGKEFPTGGMNEKGLVVELMWLDGTEYPAVDERPSIGVLQWIQYQLDNSASIDEVVESDKRIRITKGGTPLHYLIADANGNTATIEFLEGKMVVHKGRDLPQSVLTNDTYARSVSARTKGTEHGNNSLERFSEACSMIEHFKASAEKKPVIGYAFEILDKVSQGDFTKWSIVYDIKNKRIHFKTERSTNVKSVDFALLNFDCNSQSRMININSDLTDDISLRMAKYSTEENRKIVSLSLVQSQSRIQATEADKEQIVLYPETVSCMK